MKFKKTKQQKCIRDGLDGRRCLRLIGRYVLLQIPEALILVLVIVVVDRWWPLPGWLAWGIIGLWVAKDVALFPFLWRAYDWEASDDSLALHGEQGIVVRRLDPEGYIRVRGELWRAKISAESTSIEKGRSVRVIDVEGLTLYVQPISTPHRKPPALLGDD